MCIACISVNAHPQCQRSESNINESGSTRNCATQQQLVLLTAGARYLYSRWYLALEVGILAEYSFGTWNSLLTHRRSRCEADPVLSTI